MSKTRREVVLFDLSSATPSKAVSTEPRTGKWRLIPWTMDARDAKQYPPKLGYYAHPTPGARSARAGNMLWGYPGKLPTLSLPLNFRGWYAISIGMYMPAWYNSRILLRLEGESKWNELWSRKPLLNWFEEQYWRVADLTGKRLEIAGIDTLGAAGDRSMLPDMKMTEACAGLAFVRLLPLGPRQVKAIQSAPEAPCMRTIDGASFFWAADKSVPARRVVSREIDAFAGSAFTDVSWGIGGGDLVNYDTRVGTMGPIPHGPACHHGWVNAGVNIRRTVAELGNPAILAAKLARKHDMEFWLGHRIQTWMMEPPEDSSFYSPWCLENGQWACRNRQGQRLMHMSLAFPQVRKHLLDLFAESLPAKPDGIHLVLTRGIPLTYFEKPVLDDFRREHKMDLRKLSTTDPRVTAFRGRYVTQFLRELRAMLIANGRPDCRVAVNVFQDKPTNEEFGLDVATWVREGLVERLCPYRWEALNDRKIDMAFFRLVVKGGDCQVFPYMAINHREFTTPLQELRKNALELLRGGADGLCWWDAEPYATKARWGNRAELELWEGVKPLFLGPVHTVGQFAVDEMPPYFGF